MYKRVQRNSLGIAIVINVSVGLLLYWRWLDLFPLVEFRQQIEFNSPLSWLMKNILLSGKNIFSIPFYFNSLLGKAFGTEIYCLNGSLLAIIIATGLMITLLLRRMGFRWTTSVFAGVLWQIGLPVLDSMAWQATNLDKLSALLIVLGLHVGLFWLRKNKSRYDVILCSLSLLLLTVLAYNTKPAAWVLIPILFLLPMVERGSSLRLWYTSLAVPTVYAALRSAKTLHQVTSDTFYYEHVSSGDPLHNAWLFLEIMCGSSSESIASILVVVFIAAIILYGFKFRIAKYKIGIWSLICLAGALSLALRTKYASSFYMLVPSVFFVIAVAAVSEIIIEDRRKWIQRIMATCGVFCAALFIVNIIGAQKQYDIVDRQSTSFRESIAIASTYLSNESLDQITCVVDESNYLSYKFVSGGYLESYLFSRKPSNKIQYSDITLAQWTGGVTADRTAYLMFDFEMNLVNVVINGEKVFTKN